MSDLDQWALDGHDSRIEALEQSVRELKQMVCHLDQQLADERAERVAAIRRIQRDVQDREWARSAA